MIAFVEFTVWGGERRSFQAGRIVAYAPHINSNGEKDGTDIYTVDGPPIWIEQDYQQAGMDIRWALYSAANAHETARTARRPVRERAEVQS